MAKKNKKNETYLKIKKANKGYYGGNTASVVGGLYTYKKAKKPKCLGKQCVHFNSNNLTCKLKGQLCSNAENCLSFKKAISSKNNKLKAVNKPILDKDTKKYSSFIGVTAIVINDNRKCINASHDVVDVEAIIRIAKPEGEIVNHTTQAAYCKECDMYFILKSELKKAKSIGVLLCQIIDKKTYINDKNLNKSNGNNESRIHQLGYNVQKGFGYTDKQRETILANIIENTDISKHEIASLLQKCINQHKNQQNYCEAVKCWKHDYEFVSHYMHGDMPEVLINKIKIGR